MIRIILNASEMEVFIYIIRISFVSDVTFVKNIKGDYLDEKNRNI